MPAQFGSDTTWLKGKESPKSNTYRYVNLYEVGAISKFNTNDYSIELHGVRFVLWDCVQLDDLAEIEPPEEE